MHDRKHHVTLPESDPNSHKVLPSSGAGILNPLKFPCNNSRFNGTGRESLVIRSLRTVAGHVRPSRWQVQVLCKTFSREPEWPIPARRRLHPRVVVACEIIAAIKKRVHIP